MVQIIPRAKPTFGEQVAGGITAGGQQGANIAKLFLQKALEGQNKEKDLQRKLAAVEQFKKSPGYESLSPMQKFALEQEVGGLIGTGSSKSLINAERESKLQEMISSLFSGQNKGQPLQSQPSKEIAEVEETDGIPTNGIENISPEQLAQLSLLSPELGRSIQHSQDIATREKRANIKSEETKQAALQKETLPIRKEIADRANIARRNIENKNQQIQLIDSGKLDDPTFAQIMDSLPLKFGQRFLSPETVQYKGGLVQGYNELKSIFPGATRVKEIEILENKIADIYLTDEQKKAIIKSSLDVSKVDLIREEVAAELEAEGKKYGLLQFSKEVDKRAAPRINAIFNKFMDDQNAIIKNAENRKKIPLDPRDPDDLQIAQQLMQEAGGNRTKARELAKKKGYIL